MPKHNEYKSRLYATWQHMKDRTLNPKNQNWGNYGGRGIKICEEWREYMPFRNWALSNGYKENLTLDRINNNGNYEPTNCRWATYEIQNRNQRLNLRNKSGKKGVHFHKLTKKWRAQIEYKKSKIHLGLFNTVEEAAEARRQAEIKYWGYSS